MKLLRVSFAAMIRGFATGVNPNWISYNSIIQGKCAAKNITEAERMLEEMKRKGFAPDERTCTSLFHEFCTTSSMEHKAYHLLTEMFDRGFSPSLDMHNKLIRTYCISGRTVEEAVGILRGMTEMGLTPDGVSYNTVISGFCRIEELRKAYDLMREMDVKCNRWLDKDVHISLMEDLSYLDPYSSLINGYLAEGNFQVAYTFYCEMLRLGYSSDFDSYCLFMNGLSKKARTRDAKEYLLFMIYDQCFKMPSYVTYDILIENCSNNEFKSLVELVKDLRSRGLMNEAAKAHDTMLEGNYKPDGAVYNLLIFEHCRCLNVDKAYDMYKEMMHYGFAPHMFSLIALINALHYVQMYNGKSWVIENTLRSCNLNDSELRKVLNKINVKERSIYPLLEVLAEIAMDGLLLDGGKCSYASTAASFPPPLSSS